MSMNKAVLILAMLVVLPAAAGPAAEPAAGNPPATASGGPSDRDQSLAESRLEEVVKSIRAARPDSRQRPGSAGPACSA